MLLSNVQVSSQRQLQILMLHFMGIVVGIHKSLCYKYFRLLCSTVNNIFCLSIHTDILQTLFFLATIAFILIIFQLCTSVLANS